jgi:hypothetical protein
MDSKDKEIFAILDEIRIAKKGNPIKFIQHGGDVIFFP